MILRTLGSDIHLRIHVWERGEEVYDLTEAEVETEVTAFTRIAHRATVERSAVVIDIDGADTVPGTYEVTVRMTIGGHTDTLRLPAVRVVDGPLTATADHTPDEMDAMVELGRDGKNYAASQLAAVEDSVAAVGLRVSGVEDSVAAVGLRVTDVEDALLRRDGVVAELGGRMDAAEAALGGKADAADVTSLAGLVDQIVADKAEADDVTALNGRISDTEDEVAALGEAVEALGAGLAGKADTGHTHAGVYAPATHTHADKADATEVERIGTAVAAIAGAMGGKADAAAVVTKAALAEDAGIGENRLDSSCGYALKNFSISDDRTFRGMDIAHYEWATAPLANVKETILSRFVNKENGSVGAIEEGKWYVLSWWMRSGVNLHTYVACAGSTSTYGCVDTSVFQYRNNGSSGINSDAHAEWPAADKWTFRSVAFKAKDAFPTHPSGNYANILFRIRHTDGNEANEWVEIAGLKLEEDDGTHIATATKPMLLDYVRKEEVTWVEMAVTYDDDTEATFMIAARKGGGDA